MYENILETIGNTPLVRVSSFDTGSCTLFAKLENQNPGGSIKDRVALSVIKVAEEEGKLKPGGIIIEATAGNTGLGLAVVARAKGYKLILVIPDKMSREKVLHLRAMGAEVRMTRSDVNKGHPQYYQDMAEKLSQEIPNSFYVNQFGNPANPLAHATTTGPEIWEQMGHNVDAIFCGVGSGGTITGLGQFFSIVNPNIDLVIADPKGSIVKHYVDTKEVLTESGSWVIEGIGEDFIPPVSDLSYATKAYTITDTESLNAARELLFKEGILGGSSTGTLLAAALKYCKEQTTPKRVVFLVCDSGNKYLSKMYDDNWMYDQGFLNRPQKGDLRDFISRKSDDGVLVTVGPDETLLTTLSRMNLYSVSQLPVMNGDKAVGIVDEMDLLLATHADKKNFKKPVKEFMSTHLVTLAPTEPLDSVIQLLDKGLVAIIEEDGKFLGLITRMDVLNYFKRKLL